MRTKLKKIAVLTSGGDSPGMNNAISAIIKSAISSNIEPYVIYDGYSGLVNNKIVKVDLEFALKINNRGGTAIGTARLKEFQEEKIRQRAVENLKTNEIDGLIVIGGDGSYNGAMALSKMGVNCIALPGTIDNDINGTDATIGFDTTLNTVTDAIDRIRDTNNSHHRCGIIEVMGRYCGDIALYTSLGSAAEIVSSSENRLSVTELINQVQQLKTQQYRSILIIVSEHIYPNLNDVANKIEVATGFETRATILGHIQRGGKPLASDRLLATKMGILAVKALLNNKTGICLGIKNNDIIEYKIEVALEKNKTKKDLSLFVKHLSNIS